MTTVDRVRKPSSLFEIDSHVAICRGWEGQVAQMGEQRGVHIVRGESLQKVSRIETACKLTNVLMVVQKYFRATMKFALCATIRRLRMSSVPMPAYSTSFRSDIT